MFTAWVIDSAGDAVKQFDDCMNISVYTENQMQEQFPEIIDAIGFAVIMSQSLILRGGTFTRYTSIA